MRVSVRGMDDPLRLIAAHHGVFLRREALECGMTDRSLQASCRAGVLHRVRHGCYCFADVWSTSTATEKHVILAKAVFRTTPGAIAFSHTTALVLHGVDVWGVDLSRVHVTRLGKGSGRHERDVTHHVGVSSDDDVMKVDGLPVVVAERAVLEAACLVPLESGVVSADSALHKKLCLPEGLHDRAGRMREWCGSPTCASVLTLMDGRSESVGESRGRLLLKWQGLPAPDLQLEIYDRDGTLVAVTDWAWHEHKAFGEFDGRVKYEKLRREGESASDVVVREKTREDLVRGLTGYACGRMIWADLARPARTAAYFRHILGLD